MTKERPVLMSNGMVSAIIEGRKTQTRRVVKLPGRCAHLVKGFTDYQDYNGGFEMEGEYFELGPLRCPYGKPGDQLWVRETFCIESVGFSDQIPSVLPDRPYKDVFDDDALIDRLIPHYRATEPTLELCYEGERPLCSKCETGEPHAHWQPSIFMPRWASRITLEIASVRVQRLQDISIQDAIADGIRCPDCGYTLKDCQEQMDHPICVNKWLAESKSKDVGYHSAIAAFAELWDSINRNKHPWESNPFCWAIEFEVVR